MVNICKKRLLLVPMAFILLFTMVGIGGCATVEEEELIAPEVSLTSVNIIYHAAGAALLFENVMQISNPNEVPVTVTSLNYMYYANDNYLALGGLPDPVYIIGNEEVTVRAVQQIKVATLFLQIANQAEDWEIKLDLAACMAIAAELVAAIDAGEAEWRFTGQAQFDSELGAETVIFDLLWP